MSDTLATPPSDIQRVVFLGTPDVSAVALNALIDAGFEVPLVISRADRRRGRGSQLIPSPVKQAAMDLGLETSDDLAAVADLDVGRDVDLGVVVAYGRIIPMSLLTSLPMVNIHFSLLPRWRGAAPVERSILAGDSKTGVCLMEVAEGLDEGGVYARVETPIADDERAEDLRSRLGVLGATLLVESLRSGLGVAEPQTGETTYAAKLAKDEARLDFGQTAIELHRRVRVGRAWTEFRGKRLGIEGTVVHNTEPSSDSQPGEIDGLMVSTKDGMLKLVTVKPEGKRAMPASDWANGVQPRPGELLG